MKNDNANITLKVGNRAPDFSERSIQGTFELSKLFTQSPRKYRTTHPDRGGRQALITVASIARS